MKKVWKFIEMLKFDILNFEHIHLTTFTLNHLSYYPFGMLMPGRKFNPENYNYGFNGQEKDDELTGLGNTMSAEYWEYDSRSGRRWNIDPVIRAWQSNYATFAGNPIFYSDPSGDYELGEVIITAPKTPTKFGNILRGLGNIFTELAKQSLHVVGGAVDAWRSDNMIGGPRKDASEFGRFSSAVKIGNRIGDLVALGQGIAEMAGGLGGGGLGGAMVISGVGTIPGLVVVAGSTAAIAHGRLVAANALTNMMNSEKGKDNVDGNSNYYKLVVLMCKKIIIHIF